MARSELNDFLVARRRARDETRTLDELSERAVALARQGYRDYAATHGLTYAEARQRLRAMKQLGRTRLEPGDDE